MIKTVMFDQGGVLLTYEPQKILKSFGYDEKTIEFLVEKILRHTIIRSELYRGNYDFNYAIDAFCAENPKYEKEIRFTLKNKISDFLTVNSEISDFLKELKNEGYNIYILSNFSSETFELLKNNLDYLNYVDELIISADVGMIKPDAEIFEYVINKFGVVPAETIFIDDREWNIEAAEKLGFRSVLCTSADEVKNKVRVLLNER